MSCRKPGLGSIISDCSGELGRYLPKGPSRAHPPTRSLPRPTISSRAEALPRVPVRDGALQLDGGVDRRVHFLKQTLGE
jgi:hypothetical protein